MSDYAGPGDMKSGVGLFRDDDVADDAIIRARRKKEDRKIIIVHNDMLEKYAFPTLKVEKMILDPQEVGLNQNFFGGQCKRCALIKDSPYIVILNSANQTIGLYLPKDTECLTRLNIRELIDIAKRQGFKVSRQNKKEELVELLTNM